MSSPAASPSSFGSRTGASWAQEKFTARAKALFYTRLAFLGIGLAVLATPAWSRSLGINRLAGFMGYFVMLGYSVANYIVIGHPRVGRWATFVTLCFDLLALLYLTTASGGLTSPIMGTQLLFTTLFVILFPRPLAVLPPLLLLPLMAKIDQIVWPHARPVQDLLIVAWYSALNFIVVYMVVYVNEREEGMRREMAALERHLREMAVVEERSRMAREIHDGLGAALSSLILQAQYLEGMAKDEALLKEIRELRGSAEESIDELRRSLRMMREDFDLVPAVEDYCRTFSERSKLAVAFDRAGYERAISSDGQVAIFRVLQESLANAAKHSKAGMVEVKLHFGPDLLRLAIHDDGLGFDPSAPKEGHYGLINMRERAAKVGGRVDLSTAPGKGTAILLEIPYQKERPAAGSPATQETP